MPDENGAPTFEEIEAATQEIKENAKLLPAWFTWRMMMDQWGFGLMLTNGAILAITTITKVTRDTSGALWLDVELMEGLGPLPLQRKMAGPIIYAPTTRLTASVAAAHVVAAFELKDT